MRILMLAHRIPYPPHTGDKTRAFHIARHLARRHDLTLACLVDERADLDGLAPLREIIPSIEFGRLWKPWSLLKGVAGLTMGGPLSLPYFRSRALRRRLASRLDSAAYDLVYASSTPMAQYARGLDLPMVMDFVDVDSDKWRQYAERSRPPVNWLYRTEGRRLETAEADVARWARVCLLATEAEEKLLKGFAPWARSAVMPNGIDLDYYQPVGGPSGQPVVLFTGAMDYLPNVDAVRYFCDEILPLVRREVPETRFYIVGLNPTPDVQRLGSRTGITVTGSVPDVRPYYARASVCVAPLRIGRGIQNKVLQGMAMGLPLVVSSLAGRGLDAEPGRHLEVADTPAPFADHVVRLLKRPESGRALGRSARGFVEANFGWERSLRHLERLLVEAVGRGPAPAHRSASDPSGAVVSPPRPGGTR